MKHFITAVAINVLTFALAGCGSSSPPTDADVRAAVAASMGGAADMFKDQIAKAKVIACVKSEAGGFKCDFVGVVGPQSGRFVKSDAGWVLIMGG